MRKTLGSVCAGGSLLLPACRGTQVVRREFVSGSGARWCWVVLGWATLLCAGCAPSRAAQTPRAAKTQSIEVPTGPAELPETYKYCAATVTEWEVHQCVWELTPEQQRRRSYSQRLVYRDGRLERMETVTGSGALYKSDTTFTNTYRYAGGRITEWLNTNRNGVEKGRGVYTEGMRLALWYDDRGRPKVKKDSHASGLRRRLSATGRVLSYAWVDSAGRPTPFEGVYRVDVKRSPQGAVLEESFFGANDEPVRNAKGAHRIVHVVDEHGLDLELRYFDEQGEPTPCEGAYLKRMKYDDVGNTVDVMFFDSGDNLTMSLSEGAARLHYTHDARGNEIKMELFDATGRPIVGPDYFASRTRRFDEQDLPIEWAFFGADGAPLRLADRGNAIMRQTRDARGNVLRERFFDENAVPILGDDGYHAVDIGYDARDNPISYRYTDVAGAPVMVKQGYQWRELTYDGDRLTRIEYFDGDDRPVNAFGNVGITDISYAEDGSEATRRSVDASGSPRLSCHGSLTPELQADISARAAVSRGCYEQLLRTSPKAAGKLVVELRLDNMGNVARAALVGDELEEPELSSCVLRLMRTSFAHPPEGGCANVRVPFRFQPKASP